MTCIDCGKDKQDYYPRNKSRCKLCVIKMVMVGKRSYADGNPATVDYVETMKHRIRQENLDKMQEVA